MEIVSRPPSTSRVTLAPPSTNSILEANVACGQPSSAASIWPVWFESSSIACLPRMIIPGCSSSATPFQILATASGSTSSSVCTSTARSAPMARAVRRLSWALAGPIETTTISVAAPFSRRRIASSTAISSNGFIDILTLARSTPEPSILTLGLTLKSITRLTATKSFIRLSCFLIRSGEFFDLRDDLPGGVSQIVGGDDRQSAHRQYVLALLDVGAFQTDDQRHAERNLLGRLDNAFGDDVAAHDPAEDIDQDALHR